MRKTLLLSLMLAITTVAMAQMNIPGTRVFFDFPQGGWKYLQTTEVDKNTQVYLYTYSAQNVVDSKGDTVLPCLRIYVRKNYDKSMFKFIMERFKEQPYQSLDEYTEGIPGDEAFGYIAAYTDQVDKKDYGMRMVCFKDKTTVVEFRLETTFDTYPAFEKQFEEIASTLKIKK
ncbi:MAG: hypothetical protein SPJ13_01675 [Bacteroidales bacterium]|nr:hypothetical protein [Bacteroidales bacterium]